MGLIDCPGECGNKVSDEAPQCPHCGCPVAEKLWETAETELLAKVRIVFGFRNETHQFHADVKGPYGQYVEAFSPKFKPNAENYQKALQVLVEELRAAGWEETVGPGGPWWKKRFRRRAPQLAPGETVVFTSDDFFIPSEAELAPNATMVLIPRGSSAIILDAQESPLRIKIRLADGRVGFMTEATGNRHDQHSHEQLERMQNRQL